MKWILTTIHNLPEPNKRLNLKWFSSPCYGYYDKELNVYIINSVVREDVLSNVEFLDESNNEPVFTIEDMKSAWEDGKFEGVRDYQMNDGETFEVFMKENFNIDL